MGGKGGPPCIPSTLAWEKEELRRQEPRKWPHREGACPLQVNERKYNAALRAKSIISNRKKKRFRIIYRSPRANETIGRSLKNILLTLKAAKCPCALAHGRTHPSLPSSASRTAPREPPGSPSEALPVCLSILALCLRFASVLPQTTNKEGENTNHTTQKLRHQKPKSISSPLGWPPSQMLAWARTWVMQLVIIPPPLAIFRSSPNSTPCSFCCFKQIVHL